MSFSLKNILDISNLCYALALFQKAGGEAIETRSAQQIIEKLELTANVEKGWYRETYADPHEIQNRTYSTAIYYLLEGSVGPSYWHRVDATEMWHYYAGAPLRLDLSWNNGTTTTKHILGSNVFEDEVPQVAIETNQWQRAESLGDWTLVGTTVAPGFITAGFELAPPEWEPISKVENLQS